MSPFGILWLLLTNVAAFLLVTPKTDGVVKANDEFAMATRKDACSGRDFIVFKLDLVYRIQDGVLNKTDVVRREGPVSQQQQGD